MKKFLFAILGLSFILPSFLSAKSVDGLNVVLTSEVPQTQKMAMVLSLKTLKKGKKVNMVLCSKAGDLAIKGLKSKVLKPLNKSPKMLLKALIKKGANVKICPLYLPNENLKESSLLDGIKVASPQKIADYLLDENLKNLSY